MIQRHDLSPKRTQAKIMDGRWLAWLVMVLVSVGTPMCASADTDKSATNWISTWSAASQPPIPGSIDQYHAQTLRLIVHVSAGGSRVRIRLSNRDGDVPITIGAAHIARRTNDADIDASSDRALTFGGHASVVVPAHADMLSDPVSLDLPALSDAAVSVFIPDAVTASTVHVLAQQRSYVSQPGNAVAVAHFPVARRIGSWAFLNRVDVEATAPAFTVVAFGDSTVDGDGTTPNANQRWPDALAVRLQQAGQNVAVINQGMIGNRLLHDSPSKSPFGEALGKSGMARFQHDALDQPGAKVVIVRTGGNDLGFIDVLAPKNETVTADDLIAGYKRLIAQAHQRGVGIIGSTNPPFENADIPGYYTPAKDAIRQKVNAWIRTSHAFDAVLDFDAIVRDPSHPSRLLPAYDSGDHLHPNDVGYRAIAAAIPLATLEKLSSMRAPVHASIVHK